MEKFNEKYFDVIGTYWSKYIENGERLPENLHMIRPEILDSWRRSKEYGISPFEIKSPDIKKAELDYILKKNKTLIQISRSHMQKLYFYVKGTNFAFALVEKNGIVIDFLADDTLIKKQANSSGLEIGCSRSEESVGTSGIAICLATGKPYAVYEKEHFIKSHHNYVCCAAPIFAAEEKLLGCLALIGPSNLAPAHTHGMVIAAADGIEKELRLNIAYEDLSKTNNKLQFTLNSLSSDIILINNNGFITQYNKSADDMLGFGRDLSSTHINELFNDENIVTEILSSDTNISNREVTVKKAGGKDQKFLLDVFYNRGSNSDIILKLERAGAVHKLVNKISGFRANYTFDTIIGNSPAINEVKKLGHLAAKTDSTVLLLGESGVGKDIFAQAIHNASERCEGPFIAINCASLPKSLIESELFGYEDGAFTGAKKNGNPGKFELAEGGTIFLDEIGDMPLELQTTLLRVLQNKEIVRIGGKHAKPVNVRIIAATNTDLVNAVKNKQFRSDLYYRINVLSIYIPPLRERISDIPMLVEHFIATHDPDHSAALFRPEIMQRFCSYSWPGNVRELENVTERAIIMQEDASFDINAILNTLPAADNTVTLENRSFTTSSFVYENLSDTMPAPGSEGSSTSAAAAGYLSPSQEQQKIIALLREEHGHVATVAARLQMQKRTLYRKIKKYNIELKDFQQW